MRFRLRFAQATGAPFGRDVRYLYREEAGARGNTLALVAPWDGVRRDM